MTDSNTGKTRSQIDNNKSTTKKTQKKPALNVNEIINSFLERIRAQVPKTETTGLLYALRVKNIEDGKQSMIMPVLITQFMFMRNERVKVYPFLRGFSISHTGHDPILVNANIVLPNMINVEARNEFISFWNEIEQEGGYENYMIALKVDDLVMLGYVLSTRVGQSQDISSAEAGIQMLVSSFAVPQAPESGKTVYRFTFSDTTASSVVGLTEE